MEDFFNLPPSDDAVSEEEPPVRSKEELMNSATEIYNSLSTAEKIDNALPMVTGLGDHDREMDDIAFKAVRTFEDLLGLAGNVPDMHAGKIYEVAGQMLKTALDAKNSKAERKLKMIELQLKKARAEQIDFEQGNGKAETGHEFDRNELLRHIVSSKESSGDQ